MDNTQTECFRPHRHIVRSVSVAVLFLTAVSGMFSCGTKKLRTADLEIRTASGTAVSVRAELAVTDAERQRGFMERKKIPDGTGMLFVFETDFIAEFWMKNTPSPLSIAYIDSRGIIRDIYDMTPYSLASVTSTVSVRYALEVPQGWFDRVGVAVGDMLMLPDSF